MLPNSISGARTAPSKPPANHGHSVNLRALLEIDVVSLLARRTGVDPASIRHQLAAFGLEAR